MPTFWTPETASNRWMQRVEDNQLHQCEDCGCYTEEKLIETAFVPQNVDEDYPATTLQLCSDCRYNATHNPSIVVVN